MAAAAVGIIAVQIEAVVTFVYSSAVIVTATVRIWQVSNSLLSIAPVVCPATQCRQWQKRPLVELIKMA